MTLPIHIHLKGGGFKSRPHFRILKKNLVIQYIVYLLAVSEDVLQARQSNLKWKKNPQNKFLIRCDSTLLSPDNKFEVYYILNS
jgi:hypothetical protein